MRAWAAGHARIALPLLSCRMLDAECVGAYRVLPHNRLPHHMSWRISSTSFDIYTFMRQHISCGSLDIYTFQVMTYTSLI